MMRPKETQADEETRTPDPFITSEVLYQLSYVGTVLDASDAALLKLRQLLQQGFAVALAEGWAYALDRNQLVQICWLGAQDAF